ncbi:NusG domain II-containing protein [Carnobacterium sp. ISL-102]|uniref:NusG domain II-containing protein n=1 Tax=Carnobacterium sp. ISL-102 TaxID=2819142 RepID=UPI00333675C7
MPIKKYLKSVKPFTIIIVSLLIIVSVLSTVTFAVQNTQNEASKLYAVISINGEEVDRFLLTENEENQLITYYPAPGKYNIIEIDGERIRNKEDNSPRQIAVRTGWIQDPGQTILNLPHRLNIEIVSDNPEEAEIDVLSQ